MNPISKYALVLGALPCLMVAVPAHADVVIGPRFSYYFDNGNLRTSSIAAGQSDEGGLVNSSDLEGAEFLYPGEVEFNSQREGTGIVADQVAVPMIGAMVNFGDDRDRFTITAMYGDGSGSLTETIALSRSANVAGVTAQDFGASVVMADFSYDRIDAELTWQRRLNENFAVLGGLRYERLERNGPGEFTFGLTSNVDNLLIQSIAAALGDPPPDLIPDVPPVSANFIENAALETFSARFGATAFVPVGDNNVAFFSGMIHASHQPGYTSRIEFVDANGAVLFGNEDVKTGESSIGPDMAVGVQFILTENLALDMRYRAIVFFPLSGDFDFNDARVNHGVNIGVSLRL